MAASEILLYILLIAVSFICLVLKLFTLTTSYPWSVITNLSNFRSCLLFVILFGLTYSNQYVTFFSFFMHGHSLQ